MTTVHDAATYFISRAHEDGNLITHLKLQKLCYYAQGYSLALMSEPMFSEPIEAWEHGPVVRELYDRYKKHRRSPIPNPAASPEIERWRVTILDMVHRRLGWMSASELRNRTHAEVPWQEAWNSDDPNPVLSNPSMRDFFRSTLRGQRLRPAPAEESVVLKMLKENDALREATARGRSDLRAGRRFSWIGSSEDAV